MDPYSAAQPGPVKLSIGIFSILKEEEQDIVVCSCSLSILMDLKLAILHEKRLIQPILKMRFHYFLVKAKFTVLAKALLL